MQIYAFKILLGVKSIFDWFISYTLCDWSNSCSKLLQQIEQIINREKQETVETRALFEKYNNDFSFLFSGKAPKIKERVWPETYTNSS